MMNLSGSAAQILMVGLGEPILDPIGFADHVEVHWPGIEDVPVSGLLYELNAIIDERDLHRFCPGLLRAILAIKETGHGSNT